MNTSTKKLAAQAGKRGMVIATCLVAWMGVTQPVAAATCTTSTMTTLERRAANEAAKGPEGLRRFISRTGMIYQLDYLTVDAKIDAARRDELACQARLAASQGSVKTSASDRPER